MRNWELGITHVPQKWGLVPEHLSILAALLECRDLLRRVRCTTIDYDDCDSPVDEIIEACGAVDRAIAGYVESKFAVSWAWDKEVDRDMILLDWLGIVPI